MLARRLCASVRSAVSAPPTATVNSRAFAALAAARNPIRAPSLADIKPDGAAEFAARQKEFRDGLKAAQLKQEQQDS